MKIFISNKKEFNFLTALINYFKIIRDVKKIKNWPLSPVNFEGRSAQKQFKLLTLSTA